MKISNDQIYKRERQIEKFEIWMLILAFIAVGLYMADLVGVWTKYGVEKEYHDISFAIDFIFVINLLFKIIALRSVYLTNPWFTVDLISSIPILASVAILPGTTEALRFVRGFRLFRALRALRLLNVMPILQIEERTTVITKEAKKLTYAMWILLPTYTFLFVKIVNWLYHSYPNEAPLFEFFLILGSLFGLFIAVMITYYQIPAILSVQINRLLNVALPSQVANFFLVNPKANTHTVMMPATIIFCDIKDFTATVEKMSNDLKAVKSNLESVMNAITAVHSKYDLIIDKFIGDAVMSFRGGDLVTGTPEMHAWCVVKAGLESIKVMSSLKNPFFHEIKVSGASTDVAMIGTFGTTKRLSYTILGDRVNLAARLESAVKQCGTSNLFCDQTYDLLKNNADFVWRRFGKILVDGKITSLDIYEAFDAADIQDKQWIEQYHQALENFEKQKFDLALQGFLKASELRPGGDKPSKKYCEICMALIKNPPGDSWNPIFIPK